MATAVDGDGQVWQFPAVEGAQVPAPWTAPSHVADHGWAGVDVHPADGNTVASARYHQRSVAVYTGGVCTRVAHLPTPPHRIHYAATGQLYVVAGPSVLVVDPRVSEHGGIVDRAKVRLSCEHRPIFHPAEPRAPLALSCVCAQIQAHSAGRLYAIATSATTVAVAGEDRTVVAYDVRKLSNVLGTWSSCLKNDVRAWHGHGPHPCEGACVHGAPDPFVVRFRSVHVHQVAWLAFRPGDDRYCYVSGAVDSELACGSWDTKLDRLNHLGNANVRVDGRWIGMDLVQPPWPPLASERPPAMRSLTGCMNALGRACKAPDRDTLVGVTVHNSLYAIDDAGGFFRELHRLARASESADTDGDLKRNRLDLDPHDM